MTNKTLKPVAATVGAAFVGTLMAVNVTTAAENPFGVTELNTGYTQLAGGHGEGKCGAGKCGGEKKSEGKCGAGKCGSSGDCDRDKVSEGKCGAGKCGGDKNAEGKCGAGRCGGS